MVSFSLQTVTEKFGTCLNQQVPNELYCYIDRDANIVFDSL